MKKKADRKKNTDSLRTAVALMEMRVAVRRMTPEIFMCSLRRVMQSGGKESGKRFEGVDTSAGK